MRALAPREILAFATRFYQLRLPGDDEAIISANLQHTPGGAPPEIISLDSKQNEIAHITYVGNAPPALRES
ncbi:hypothetical protein EKD04_017100 [Chloroflexales bacterium ZM16-3]|nr:hypothetical protein [Chloroflexales bacterium ZM16-3]